MIETERLRLRPWCEDDAVDLYRYASDERVSRLALWPCHTSIDMSRDVIRRFFMPHKDTLAMELRDSGEVIGCIGLVPEGSEHYAVGDGCREVGYWVGYPHWGKGLATEALMALADYCRKRLGIDSLLLTTDVRNVASQRVAEKCGFVRFDRYDFEGIDSLAYRLKLAEIRACSVADYAILADIWERSVRATHDFITENDIKDIKRALVPCYFPSVDLYGALSGGRLAGFVGVATGRIEMLFIDDCLRGNGIGSMLVNHAIRLGAREVDVNEQNLPALAFYEARGFRVVSRDECDDAGRPYPVLHMAL